MCRTANGFDINWFDSWKKVIDNVIDGKLPEHTFLATAQQKDGRGNICPATIIMPTLAMEARKKAKDNPEYVVDYFMDILEKAIGDCKDELIERFNWICAQNPASAKFMYENGTMYGYIPEEGIRSALKHGTLAIGQIGLAETLQILIGCDHTTEKGMELAKRIEQLFKDKANEYKHEWHSAPVTSEQLASKMIQNIELSENRSLSDTEKSDILEYCKSKLKK